MALLFTSLLTAGTGTPPPPPAAIETFFADGQTRIFEHDVGLTAQVATSNVRSFLSWDVPGAHADVEILARVATDAPPANRIGLLARGSGSAGAETGWVLQRARDDESFEMVLYDAGAFTILQASGAAEFVNTDARWVWMRFRVQGTTARGRIWADGVQDEPPDWQIEATDSTLSAPGRIGLFGFDANTHLVCDHLSVGVGGAAAPSPGDPVGADQYRMDPATTDPATDWTPRWAPLQQALSQAGTDVTQIMPWGWQGLWGEAGATTTALIGADRLSLAAAGNARRAFVYWPLGPLRDCDIRARVLTTSGTNNQVRLHARLGDYALGAPERGYFIDFVSGVVELRKYDATGAAVTLDDTAGFSWQANTWYHARLRCEGDLIRGKVWAGGVLDEPAAWLLSAEDTEFAEGYAGIGLYTASGTKRVDHVRIESLDP
jgi:hypothetical protein